MDTAGDILEDMSENCTVLGLSCLQTDLQDAFLNPHLFPVTQDQYLVDGLLLMVISCLGAILNTFLIFRLPCSSGSADDSILRLQSGVDLLLLYILALRRIPLILLDPVFTSTIFPYILLYVPAIEAGVTTLSSFFFIIFVGGRHLRQMERKSYKCLNTILFSIALAFAVTVPALFEIEIMDMSRDDIEENLPNMNTTISVSEDNLVILHTDMFHQKTYKDMFRMLFNFLTSQVAVVWILPILFLHSRNVYTLNKKRKNPSDLLTPIISLFFILFSLPQLSVFMIHILLYQPPDLLIRVSGLCLACIASFKIIFYLIFDSSLRRDLSPNCCSRTRIAVPRDDF